MHDRNGLSDWSCFRTFLIRFNIRLSPVKKNYGDRRTTKQRVDSVSEVLSVKAEDIEETPTFGTNLDTDCIITIHKIFFGWNKKAVWLTRYVKFVTAGKNPSPCFSPGALTNLLTI